jgi:hypothetical protein
MQSQAIDRAPGAQIDVKVSMFRLLPPQIRRTGSNLSLLGKHEQFLVIAFRAQVVLPFQPQTLGSSRLQFHSNMESSAPAENLPSWFIGYHDSGRLLPVTENHVRSVQDANVSHSERL